MACFWYTTRQVAKVYKKGFMDFYGYQKILVLMLECSHSENLIAEVNFGDARNKKLCFWTRNSIWSQKDIL